MEPEPEENELINDELAQAERELALVDEELYSEIPGAPQSRSKVESWLRQIHQSNGLDSSHDSLTRERDPFMSGRSSRRSDFEAERPITRGDSLVDEELSHLLSRNPGGPERRPLESRMESRRGGRWDGSSSALPAISALKTRPGAEHLAPTLESLPEAPLIDTSIWPKSITRELGTLPTEAQLARKQGRKSARAETVDNSQAQLQSHTSQELMGDFT
ncbi:hypothetical protein CYMTET_11215, partial [Cymbomonas tetramitiformis]